MKFIRSHEILSTRSAALQSDRARASGAIVHTGRMADTSDLVLDMSANVHHDIPVFPPGDRQQQLPCSAPCAQARLLQWLLTSPAHCVIASSFSTNSGHITDDMHNYIRAATGKAGPQRKNLALAPPGPTGCKAQHH